MDEFYHAKKPFKKSGEIIDLQQSIKLVLAKIKIIFPSKIDILFIVVLCYITTKHFLITVKKSSNNSLQQAIQDLNPLLNRAKLSRLISFTVHLHLRIKKSLNCNQSALKGKYRVKRVSGVLNCNERS